MEEGPAERQPRPHGHMSLMKKAFSSGEIYGRGDEVG